MDFLVTSRRPLKNVKPLSKGVKYAKCKKLLPAPLVRAKPSMETIETIPVFSDSPAPEHVSFVSLYHDVCREKNRGYPTSAFLTRWEPRAVDAGDTPQAPLAQVVMEIDY